MKEMTPAYANKLIRSLEDDKTYWASLEQNASTYVAATNEEPVIPEYDYVQVASTIAAIDEKIAAVKHALNVTNATAFLRKQSFERTAIRTNGGSAF